jgi:hypothetical protein
MAAGQVNDGKAPMAEPHDFINEDALIIGSTMRHRVAHIDDLCRYYRFAVKVKSSTDSAHDQKSRS